jgi:hypothetical protein
MAHASARAAADAAMNDGDLVIMLALIAALATY